YPRSSPTVVDHSEMYFPAIATSFRLLVKCFVKPSIPLSSVSKLSTIASTTSIINAVMKSVETTEEAAQRLVEALPKADRILGVEKVMDDVEKTIAETIEKSESIGNMETIAFQAFQSLPDSSKVQVECVSKEGVLQ
ncbi:unnamed protein product, partial [Rhizoctonia solani]